LIHTGFIKPTYGLGTSNKEGGNIVNRGMLVLGLAVLSLLLIEIALADEQRDISWVSFHLAMIHY